MAPQPTPNFHSEALVIAAAMRLAANRSWTGVTLGEIAAEAGIDLAALYQVARSKPAILGLLARQVDTAVLATPTDASETARDRLLDVLMRRFEALKPYRAGLTGWARSVPAEAPLVLCRLGRSLAWTLEAAGVSSAGIAGLVRIKLLGLVYVTAFRAFLKDDSEELAGTMAALDRAMSRAEPFLRLPVSSDAAPDTSAPVAG